MRGHSRSTSWLWSLTLFAVGCGPPMFADSSGEFGTENLGMTEDSPGIDGSCGQADPALELTLTHAGEAFAGDECVVTVAESDPDDPSYWTFAVDCTHATAEIRLMMDPPLVESPVSVDDVVIAFFVDSPEVRFFELTTPTLDRGLSVVDYRGPPELIPFSDPFFLQSPDLEWSPAGCSIANTSCDLVEGLRVEATDVEYELGIFGPEQRYVEIVHPQSSKPYLLWVGENWTGDCDGEETQQVSFALVAPS